MTERFVVRSEWDVAAARTRGRQLALSLGFGLGDATLVATAISEIANNLVMHAGGGELWLESVKGDGGQVLLRVIAEDKGPGIAEPQLAMMDGYSTVGTLGMGLPGARRMMDEFDLQSRPGEGTRVVMGKWLQPPAHVRTAR